MELSLEDLGWAQLAKADWRSARSSFEESIQARESPGSLEGLSWAAWWLDDEQAVFDARERAYRLYQERGDAAGAARMATWLAGDHLDFHGAPSVASGWLQRARRLLEPLDPGPDHGWLAFMEGYLALLSGDIPKTRELAIDTARFGRQFALPDLEMLGLAMEGTSLIASGQVKDGMRHLDEATATALAGDARIPISIAWTCCFLVGACVTVLDFDRAFEWCDRIHEFSERYGSRYMLAYCRGEYGAVHLWRGRWADAENMLERAIEDFSRTRPAWIGSPLVNLAELRMRQGRRADAVSLLERAGSGIGAQLCRARMAMDDGDPLGAIELLERTLRQLPAHAPLKRAPLLGLLARARAQRGELEEAASALTALRELEQLVGTPPFKATVDFAEGVLVAARGEHDRARILFEDALDCFDRCGAKFEAAQVRIALASCLASLGRHDAAEREASTACEALLELGANAEPARRLLLHSKQGPSEKSLDVTPREREVLALLAEGLTNRQIAEKLNLSEHTVHRHVTNILRKLDLPSRAAAAAFAVRTGVGSVD